MPIKPPGKRNRHGRLTAGKRSVVAVLSLVAMVDLFTVLVVFLLQNYATTGEVLEIPEGVELPQAKSVKDLKPANVVILSKDGVRLNDDQVVTYNVVQSDQDWVVDELKNRVVKLIEEGEKEKLKLGSRLKNAVSNIKDEKEEELDKFRKMTIQADEKIDFLTLKKVMFTVTEAGIYEINFAVLKRLEE